MKEIILHVGMHKTGSSSIQSALSGYDDGVAKYADLGYENHSIPFYTAFSGDHHNYHIWKSAGLSAGSIEKKKIECLESIERCLDDLCWERIIFSGEDISLIPDWGVVEIANIFKKSHAKVSVIGYFRDPSSFVQSNWQENIKHGINSLNLRGPSYRARFEKFIKLFGGENVCLRYFKNGQLVGGDAVSDFCAAASLNHQKIAPQKFANESLSTEAIKCIYILNSLISPLDGDPRLNEARRVFISVVSKILPGKFSAPVELINHAIADDDCEWLESVTGVSLSRGISRIRCGDLGKEADSFLRSLPDETIDLLIDYLGNVPSFNRDPVKLVHRLYLDCFESKWRQISFDAERYLALNPDVKAAGANPYQHYLRFGIKEGRRF